MQTAPEATDKTEVHLITLRVYEHHGWREMEQRRGGWAPGGTGRRASVCVGSGDAAGGEGGSVRGEAFVAVRSPVNGTLVVPAVVRIQLRCRGGGSQVVFITPSGMDAHVNVVVGATITIGARAQAA